MTAACGRADLVRLLASPGGDALLDSAARTLGFEYHEPKQARPAEQALAAAVGQAAGHSTALAVAGATLEVEHERPQYSFLQVVERTYPKPQELTLVPREQAPWDDEYECDPLSRPESQPLVPWPLLWRRLRPLLSREVVSAGTDVPQLVELMSRAEPIRKLPQLSLRRFAPHVRILVDRSRRLVPFWNDQDQVCRALNRWTVKRNGRPRFCSEGMDPHALLQSDPLEDALQQDHPEIHETLPDQREDYRGVLVLLVGDLGAYGEPEERQFWQDAGRLLTAAGAELRALVPSPAWRPEPHLAQQWNVMPWDARERDLRPIAPAERRQRAEQLLTLVSPAIRVEPGLLRAARALLSPEATDTGTEADACSHSAVLSQSSVALTLDPDKLRQWRKSFLNLPREVQLRFVELLRQWHGGEQKPFGELLQQWHGSLPPEILAEELLALAEQPPPKQGVPSVIGDEERQALRNFFLRAASAIDQDLRSGEPLDNAVDGWFRRFEARLPESIWQHPDLGEPLRRAWAVVHRDDVSPKSPPGLDANALRDLFPDVPHTPRRWRLWQVGNRIEVLPAEVSSRGGPPIPRPQRGVCSFGSALAEMMIAAPRLTIAAANQAGRTHELNQSGETSIELPVAASVTITSDCEQLQFVTTQQPPWAKKIGRDVYGLFAEFEYKGITQRMRWIAPGKFNMGSPENELERSDDETLHEVTLTEGYWIADTACTQELWQAVMGQNPSRFKNEDDGKSPKRPVEQVSWEDSKSFCERLNEAFCDTPGDGHVFRLPTEAEWENACRSGTETRFSFGENVTLGEVNYNGEYPYAGGAKGKSQGKPVAVKELPANPWGIHEMHGNVWEWCEDWYGPYEGGNVVDPKGPDSGTSRVLRGGSWYDDAGGTRSAYRLSSEPGDRCSNIGFRLVRGRFVQQETAGKSGATERHRIGEGTEPREMPRGRGAGVTGVLSRSSAPAPTPVPPEPEASAEGRSFWKELFGRKPKEPK